MNSSRILEKCPITFFETTKNKHEISFTIKYLDQYGDEYKLIDTIDLNQNEELSVINEGRFQTHIFKSTTDIKKIEKLWELKQKISNIDF